MEGTGADIITSGAFQLDVGAHDLIYGVSVSERKDKFVISCHLNSLPELRYEEVCIEVNSVLIAHAGDIVADSAVGIGIPCDSAVFFGEFFGILDIVGIESADKQFSLGLLLFSGRILIHLSEHESLEVIVSLANIWSKIDDIPSVLYNGSDEGSDTLGFCIAEHSHAVSREVERRQDTGADGVLNIVIYVSDGISESYDIAFFGSSDLIGMTGDTVFHSEGEVKAPAFFLQGLDDADALQVVLKAVGTDLIENSLTAVTERRVTEVMTESDSLSEILIQAQTAGNSTCYLSHLEGMCQTGAVVVADRREEDLSLSFKSAEGVTVEDTIAVALEIGAVRTFFLIADTAGILFVVACAGVVAKERHFVDLSLFADSHNITPL